MISDNLLSIYLISKSLLNALVIFPAKNQKLNSGMELVSSPHFLHIFPWNVPYIILCQLIKFQYQTFFQNIKQYVFLFVVDCAIWHHLYNLKREKHPWRSVNFSKVAGLKPATLLKLTLLHGYFSHFLYCTNGIKSRNAPHREWKELFW